MVNGAIKDTRIFTYTNLVEMQQRSPICGYIVQDDCPITINLQRVGEHLNLFLLGLKDIYSHNISFFVYNCKWLLKFINDVFFL